MARVTFWQQLLLLFLTLKQSDAAAYRSGELQEGMDCSEEDMTNTTGLKHYKAEQADNCWACQSLPDAAQSGEVNVVKNLLKCCKDNCTDRDGFRTRALMYAAGLFGNVEVVRVLLEGGVSAETATDNTGWTALHEAAWKGHLDVCRLLLDWGATVDSVNELNETALRWAAKGGHLSVVKLLVERGADVRLKDNNGSTPLHVAAWMGHLSVVKLLVEKGADVNAQINNGSTPLHVAARYGYLSVVKLLVEKGADVRLKDKDGQTARDVELSEGKEDVAEWLDSVKESDSHDVDTEACSGTATDCLTSVPSQNQTAILESGQHQGMQTAAGEPAEKLGLVSRKEDRDCGAEEDACRSLLEAARSGGVERAEGLAVCGNCTDGSFFPVTPQTEGLQTDHVDTASNNSQLMDRLTEVNVRGNRSVRGGLWLCPGRKIWGRSPGMVPCRLRHWSIWKR